MYLTDRYGANFTKRTDWTNSDLTILSAISRSYFTVDVEGQDAKCFAFCIYVSPVNNLGARPGLETHPTRGHPWSPETRMARRQVTRLVTSEQQAYVFQRNADPRTLHSIRGLAGISKRRWRQVTRLRRWPDLAGQEDQASYGVHAHTVWPARFLLLDYAVFIGSGEGGKLVSRASPHLTMFSPSLRWLTLATI